jgi:hypothetical protein
MARKKKEPAPETEQQPAKNPHAQALGKLGGLKGGKARAAKLSPEKRSEIAKKAAAKRWGKKRSDSAQNAAGSSM